MLLIIDHHDSFSAMIADYCRQLGVEQQMITTDQITSHTLTDYQPRWIIIGPGPGHPSDQTLVATKRLIGDAIARQIPLLGICLGHQLIGEIYGAKIITAKQICHGIISEITHTNNTLFDGLPTTFKVTRYHSLLIETASLRNSELQITATTAKQEVMAIAHPQLAVYGIQFHPESVTTEYGLELLANFLTK